MTRLAASVAFAALLAGCGVLPPPPDAGLVTVGEGYHTARATPGHKQHLALTGEKQTRCRDCHDLQKDGFRSPGPELCQKCHEDQQKQHHPLDAGIDLTCLTCHAFNSSPDDPKHFERWSCIGCHAEAQNEQKPITVHKAECARCHRPHEEPFTQAADCTTCHEVSLKHGAKGDTLAETCMACHKHHSPANEASAQCVECHTKDKMPAAARVTPGAIFKPGHAGCGSCHRPHTFVKGALESCEKCHENQPVMGALHHTECVDCHRPHLTRAAPVSCESCHKDGKAKVVVKHPKDKQKGACLGCHPVHPKAHDGSLAKPCVACHDKEPFTAKVVHSEETTCADCHKPHDAKPGKLTLCASCHEEQAKAVKKNADHAKCDECHAGLPHGVKGDKKPCLSCHEKSKPPQAGHQKEGCNACHETHAGTVLKTCTDCHDGKKKALPGLHQEKEHAECAKCHGPHEPQPGFGPKTCQSCHKKLSVKEHVPLPNQCVGCHLFKDAKP